VLGAGVLRGLHYQRPPHAQGKLVRVVQGRGVRRGGGHPPLLAHLRPLGGRRAERRQPAPAVDPARLRARLPGAVSETADFLYKTTDYYASFLQAAEEGVLFAYCRSLV
jgi:dTDP-4-dehydrorhamnose 3,5-epimerase